MIIIADSGSTKTHWALGHRRGKGVVWQFVATQGLNPRIATEEMFEEALKTVRGCMDGEEAVERVQFYGAGCGTKEMQAKVRGMLSKVFTNAAEIEVQGDLLGACRAVCGQEAGTVAILGTGSNACVYDGEGIVRQVVSTGFILGDEGSGNHIGRRLLKDYMVGRMPKELAAAFAEMFPESVNDMLQRLYHEPYANRYLAAFARFAAENRAVPYIQELLNGVFAEFWKEMVVPIAKSGTEVHLVGSVASTFESEIRRAAPNGFSIGRVVKDPIEGMVERGMM